MVLFGISFARNSFRPQKVNFYFELLKDLPTDLATDSSSVEEEIARIELYREYPPHRYKIEKNLAYANSERVLGELDLVVRERRSGMVVLIAEVKSRKHAISASNHANRQLKRFEGALARYSSLEIYSYRYPDIIFNQNSFYSNWKTMVIGVSINSKHQYDRSLDITPEELRQLRERIKEYQQTVFRKTKQENEKYADFWRRQLQAYDQVVSKLLFRIDCPLSFVP